MNTPRSFSLFDTDLSAPAGLRAYATHSEARGTNPEYIAWVRSVADRWEFEQIRLALEAGKPAPCQPAVIPEVQPPEEKKPFDGTYPGASTIAGIKGKPLGGGLE